MTTCPLHKLERTLVVLLAGFVGLAVVTITAVAVAGQAEDARSILGGLKSHEQKIRDRAIRDGLTNPLVIQEACVAFLEELDRAQQPSRIIEVLRLAADLDPELLPNDQKEVLRSKWEALARRKDELIGGSAIRKLSKYRDTASYTFLHALALEKSGLTEGQPEFSKLPLNLTLALAVHDDADAISYIAQQLTRHQPGTHEFYMTLLHASPHLTDKQPIQKALLNAIPRAQALRALEGRAERKTRTDVIEGATVELRSIRSVARVLAAALDIPASTSPDGIMTIDDVLRIKILAARKLREREE